MNISLRKPVLTALLLVLLTGMASNPNLVNAAGPEKTSFSLTFEDFPIDGVCPFTIYQDGGVGITQISFSDNSDHVTRIFQHVVQHDAFSANGKRLDGLPFTFNAEILFDSAGAMTNFYVTGVYDRIPLPDGSLFISAGRADFLAHSGVTFLLSPDKGNPGNVGAFCAALAP